MGNPLQEIREEYGSEPSEDFTEEEEDTRVSLLKEYFKRNDEKLENIIVDYDKVSSVSGSMSPRSVTHIYLETYRILGQIVGKAEREGEEELKEKYEQKLEEMEEVVGVHRSVNGLYGKRSLTYYHEKSRSMMGDRVHDKQRKVVSEIGLVMMKYVDWFFEGTEVTSEGKTEEDQDVSLD